MCAWLQLAGVFDLVPIIGFFMSLGVSALLAATVSMTALLALPIAVIYPTIERIWLRQQLSDDTVATHQRLSA